MPSAEELARSDDQPSAGDFDDDQLVTAKLVAADEGAALPTADVVAPDADGAAAACDVRLLFAARFVRLFAFAAMTVVLLLLLTAAGIEGEQVGLLLTLIMVGDLGISFFLTARADALGRAGRARCWRAPRWLSAPC